MFIDYTLLAIAFLICFFYKKIIYVLKAIWTITKQIFNFGRRE